MGVLDTVKKGAKATGDFAVGVAKGAGDTLMSVKRNVQKIPAEYTKLQVQKSMNSAREAINKANEPLLKKLKELPKDDQKRAKIKELIQSNQRQFADLQTQEDEIMAEIDNVRTGKIEIKDTDSWGTKLAARAQNLLNAADNSLKTTNKAQQAGFATEKIAEFLIPSTSAVKLGKAGKVAIDANKIDKMIKGAKVVEGTSKAGKALNAAVQIGGRAGFQGSVAGLTSLGQSAYQGNLDTKEGQKQAADKAISDAKSAAIATGVFDIAGRGIKALGKMSTESRIREFVEERPSAVKNAYKKGIKYEIVDGKKVIKSDPVQTILDSGVKPKVLDGKVNVDELMSHLDDQIHVLEDSRKAVLNPNVKVPADEFKKVIISQIKNDPILQAQGKVNSTVQKLESVIDDWKSHQGDDLSLDFIDKVRQNSNKTWDPETADIMKKLGDGARRVLYDSDEAVRPFLQEEGKVIAAKKLSEKMAGKAIRGGRLGKAVAQIGGAVAGLPFGFGGSIAGYAAGNAAARLSQAQYFDPVLGQAGRILEKVGVPKLLDKAVTAGVPRILAPVSTAKNALDSADMIQEDSTQQVPASINYGTATQEEKDLGLENVQPIIREPSENDGLSDEERMLMFGN